MSEGKIEFHIGDISFVGEGQQEWLSEQLDKVIDNFGKGEQPKRKIKTDQSEKANKIDQDDPSESLNDIYSVNLSTFLRNQGATSNQRLKFLATAAWLARNNENNLKTIEVTKALKESRQPSLSNAADCLNRNVRQGYCEKDGDHFFVTPQGFSEFEGAEEE